MKTAKTLYFLFILLAAFSLTACDKQQTSSEPISDWEAMDLRGKVKSIVETNNNVMHPEWFAYSKKDYSDTKLWAVIVPIQAYCDFFGGDADVMLTNRESWPEDFYIDMPSGEYKADNEYENARIQYIFNEKGDLINEMSFLITAKKNPTSQYNYTYDDHHRMLRADHIDENLALTDYRIIEYNEAGQETKNYFWMAGEKSHTWLYTYNEKNERPTRIEFYINDALQSTNEIILDSDGKAIEELYTSPEWHQRCVNAYYTEGKAKGELYSQTCYTDGIKPERISYTLYSDDMSEKCLFDVTSKGDTVNFHLIKMDKEGREIYDAYYPEKEELPISVYTNEFDKHGNIIAYEFIGQELTDNYSGRSTFDKKDREISCEMINLRHGPIKTRTETVYAANDHIERYDIYMTALEAADDEGSGIERLVQRELYFYDAHDNWIKHEVYYVDTENNELLMASQTREIEYF